MFRKISNKILGFVFFLLLIAVVLLFVIDSGKKERTFREVLVDIDTSAVTEILIYPKSQNHKEIKLFKEEKKWKVVLTENKTASVSDSRITDVFNQMHAVKPLRLAARGDEKWNEFQVDSTGSRVIVKEGNKTTLDIVIGRFLFQQPRNMSTYVRLFNDSDVYVVDGFLDMTFNQDAGIFRDGTIVNDDYNNWQQLQFTYPSDSSFTISKTGNDWFFNGIKTDSVKTTNYLTRLSRLTNNNFIDDSNPTDETIPTYKLNITTSDLNFIEITAYKDDELYVIHSSQNPEAFFDGNSAGGNIFVGRSSFISM
jgi:hypothetical protein